MVMLQVPFVSFVIRPTPSSAPQFPLTTCQAFASLPIPACIYTLVGLVPIVLHVLDANEAVIFIC